VGGDAIEPPVRNAGGRGLSDCDLAVNPPEGRNLWHPSLKKRNEDFSLKGFLEKTLL
jgi:hypothetical protein